jgi:hypothetical protein
VLPGAVEPRSDAAAYEAALQHRWVLDRWTKPFQTGRVYILIGVVLQVDKKERRLQVDVTNVQPPQVLWAEFGGDDPPASIKGKRVQLLYDQRAGRVVFDLQLDK